MSRSKQTYAVVVTVAALVLGGLYLNERSQLEDIRRQNASEISGARLERDNALRALTLTSETLDACQAAVRNARGFAEGAVRSHESLYETAILWVNQAYRLGTVGDMDELMNGLGRVIAEEKQFYSGVFASDISSYDWLGWSGPAPFDNEAVECLGDVE